MENKPLYTKLSPSTLEEFIGQSHLTGNGKIINQLIKNQTAMSMLFYGKPGIGKTTLAKIYAKSIGADFVMFNASNQTKKELEQALLTITYTQKPMLIIDEIHRLDKAKQDFLLEILENGKVFVVGITTENPYFHTREALRSRLTLISFKEYQFEELFDYAKRIAKTNNFNIEDKVITDIIVKSASDVRTIINMLEICNNLDGNEQLNFVNQSSNSYHHDHADYYDLISAFQKSIRGSDADAAVFYLTNLLELGHLEEICRRILVISYEDIGFGNVGAIAKTKDAVESAKMLGMPEALYPLAFATIDLALSPKSRIVGKTFSNAYKQINTNQNYSIPEFIKYKNKHLYKDVYNSPHIATNRYLPNNVHNIVDFSYMSGTKYETYLYEQYEKILKLKKI